MFRCPNPDCRVVYRMPISPKFSIITNRDMNTFHLFEHKLFDEGAKKSSLAKQMAAIKEEVHSIEQAAEIVASNNDVPYIAEDEVTCYHCGKSHTIEQFIDAYHKPELHFDAEELCGCGEELWMDAVLIKGRRKYALTCDKCGWIKPGVAVSGSGDATQD